MEIPTYSSEKRRHLKFTEPTIPVSVRLPKSMVQRIKDENWDLGQLIFNVLSTGKTPVITNHTQSELLKKLIVLMISEDMTVDAGFFTKEEEERITQIAVEEIE